VKKWRKVKAWTDKDDTNIKQPDRQHSSWRFPTAVITSSRPPCYFRLHAVIKTELGYPAMSRCSCQYCHKPHSGLKLIWGGARTAWQTDGQHVDFSSLPFLLYGHKLVKINRKSGTESTKRKRMEIAWEMIQGGWKKENFLIGRNEGTGDNLPHGRTPFPCTHCHR